MNFALKFLRFVTKHGEETAVLASGLKVAANYMPMESADKVAYMAAVDGLVSASQNIAASLPELTRSVSEGGGVTTAQLKDAVAVAVKAALAEQAKRFAADMAKAVEVAVAAALKANAYMPAPQLNPGG